MTELEKPSGDSRLKEILGFDPESGEKLNGQSGTVAATTQSEIPRAIQIAFRDFAYKQKDHYISPIRIAPEKLLLILFSDENDPAKPEIIRDYFAYKLTKGHR